MKTKEEWAEQLLAVTTWAGRHGKLDHLAFIAAIQADARRAAIEACAKVCEEKERITRTRNCDSYTEGFSDGCASCEVSIRALAPTADNTDRAKEKT